MIITLGSSNQDIESKKSISLNFWVALFVFLQIAIVICGYTFKKAGVSNNFSLLYSKIITSSIMLSCSLFLLVKKGVSFSERLAAYKKHAIHDLAVSLIVGGAVTFLAFLMTRFNMLGKVCSVNPVVLKTLLSGAGESLPHSGLALTLFNYCLLGPVMEEVFFRRLLYVSLRQRYSCLGSIMINSLIFGLIHPSAVLFIFLFGVIQCYVYERFGRVSINITSHVLYNSAVTAFSFPGI